MINTNTNSHHISKAEAVKADASVQMIAAKVLDERRLEVRLAKTEAEIEASQRLRYDVFYREMSAIASPEMERSARDFDAFDAFTDHLLVIDHEEDAVVGTYRFMRKEHAAKAGGFYSRHEFDIAKLAEAPFPVMELGRSCVHENYRSRRVMDMLWQGIAKYVFEYDIKLMFGCASIGQTDKETLDHMLSYLHHHHLAPEDRRGSALDGVRYNFDVLPEDAVDRKLGLRQLPPLIKGYLRLGGYVGEGAIFDPQFNTTDILIVVETAKVTDRYLNHYTKRNEQGS